MKDSYDGLLRDHTDITDELILSTSLLNGVNEELLRLQQQVKGAQNALLEADDAHREEIQELNEKMKKIVEEKDAVFICLFHKCNFNRRIFRSLILCCSIFKFFTEVSHTIKY